LNPISIGDFNNDGYPDLLVSTQLSNQPNVGLLQSVPCSDSLCGPNSVGRRGFEEIKTDTLSGANIGVFMDLDEDVYNLDAFA
jgi:integrin alpha FG-GAP repeat containing protein 1